MVLRSWTASARRFSAACWSSLLFVAVRLFHRCRRPRLVLPGLAFRPLYVSLPIAPVAHSPAVTTPRAAVLAGRLRLHLAPGVDFPEEKPLSARTAGQTFRFRTGLEPEAWFRGAVPDSPPAVGFHLVQAVVQQPSRSGWARASEREASIPGVLPVSLPVAGFDLCWMVVVQVVQSFRLERETP